MDIDEISYIYNIVKQLKPFSDAVICWYAGTGTILVNSNNTMFYEVFVPFCFSNYGTCTYSTLSRYFNCKDEIKPEIMIGSYIDQNNINNSNMFNIISSSEPFYCSDTIKDDINNLGLKSSDGAEFIKITNHIMIPVFVGLLAVSKPDLVEMFLYHNQFNNNTFTAKFSINKTKSKFTYNQYCNLLYV